MATQKKIQELVKQDTSTLNIKNDKDRNKECQMGELQLSPLILNTIATQSFVSKIAGEVDLTEAMEVMKEKTEKIICGDLNDLESTLAAQVVSLNAIFVTLARRSASCEYINQMETNLRLALKAQAQCARTVEILAVMKNPPIVFAKQANISRGNQQVNNGIQASTPAGKTINSSNELLKEGSNAILDIRRTIKTSSHDSKMATLETINRSKNT